MCGICGVVQIGGAPALPVDQQTLDRMTDAMTHRGPDDRGTHLAPGVALGVRRLSIVDVEGGHQPVTNEDETVWAIQNGELYNHLDVRGQLEREGHRLRTRCDTEILPHLFEQHGPAFVERLRGKFGLAAWDSKARRAVIARDRLGVKPLYYARCGDRLVFASELKSVLASGLVEPELDLDGLDAYLSLGFYPAPHTPLEQVRKLLPGEQLVVADGRVTPQRYWRFPVPSPEPSRPTEERAAELLELLEESVRLRLMSDVPLGAMLSGGLDSSLIVALMARNTSGPVQTFSVGFAEAESANELEDARRVASIFGTEHHELELSLARQEVDLAELMWFQDEPIADLSQLGFDALSKLASESVTVALSGQGADELLGGYSRYRNAKIAAWLRRLPQPARRAFFSAAAKASPRARRIEEVVEAGGGVSGQLAAHAHLTPDARAAIAREPLGSIGGEAAREAVEGRLDGASADPVATMLYLDGQLGLVDDMLHYFDRASMRHSLEVRVPFLDHHLVEYCATLPTGLKLRRLTTKYLLRRAARGVVPDWVIDKPKVGFFNAAVDDWFAAQTQGVISDYLLAPDARYAEYLERAEVERLVRSSGGGSRHLLLAILMLEVWLADYLPRALAPQPRSASLGAA